MRLLILGTGGMADQHAKHFAAIEGVDARRRRRRRSGQACRRIQCAPTASSGLRLARCGARLGRVRRGRQCHAGRDPPPDLDRGAQGGQACVLREAAGHRLRQGDGDDRARRGVRRSSTWSTSPTAMSRELQKAREIVLSRRRSARSSMSRRAICRAGWSSKAWGDWRTESQWLWRLSKQARLERRAGRYRCPHPRFRHRTARGWTSTHVFARLKTFDKAPGNKIGEYELDANDSFTMAVDFSNGALGVIHATRWATGQLNELRLRVFGEKGGVEVSTAMPVRRFRSALGRISKRAPGWSPTCRRLKAIFSASPER